MTEGPMHWMAINGTYHGDYWLLKTDHFDVVLEPLSKAFTGTVVATVAGNSKLEMRPELAVDELIEKSKPAVVLLNRPDGQGSGFFISDTRHQRSRSAWRTNARRHFIDWPKTRGESHLH